MSIIRSHGLVFRTVSNFQKQIPYKNETVLNKQQAKNDFIPVYHNKPVFFAASSSKKTVKKNLKPSAKSEKMRKRFIEYKELRRKYKLPDKKIFDLPKEVENVRNDLILDNLGLIGGVIKKKYLKNPKKEVDMFSNGTIGLIKAVDTYNPDTNSVFSAHAFYLIRYEISIGIGNSYYWGTSHKARNQELKRIKKAEETLGKEPEKIAKEIGIPPRTVKTLQRLNDLSVFSMSEPVNREKGDDRSYVDFLTLLPDSKTPSPDEMTEISENKRAFIRAFNQLFGEKTDTNAQAKGKSLLDYYLDNKATFKSISEKESITSEAIRQRIEKAEQMLLKRLHLKVPEKKKKLVIISDA